MFRDKFKDGTVRLTGFVKPDPPAPVPYDPLAPWPIGSIYFNVNSTSPATLFGGTWVRFGVGRVLVSVHDSDPQFSSPKSVGGSKVSTLTKANIPPHVHDISHSHTLARGASTGTAARVAQGNASVVSDQNLTNQNTNNSGTGSADGLAGSSFNTQDPYITVYMWERTA